jgi:hypothetical protein
MSAPISELWGTVAMWAQSVGAERIDRLPGLWDGETSEWSVRVNGHGREIDGVPPYGIAMVHKTRLALAVVTPRSGQISGITEDEAISHFAAITAPEASK